MQIGLIPLEQRAKMLRYLWIVLVCTMGLSAQNKSFSFLKPSDTLHKPRRNGVVLATSGLAATTLVGLNQLWYSDYPKSDFHFVNDNNEWLQMDKAGHFLSCYHISRLSAQSMAWSGVSKKKQLYFGASAALAFMTVIEVFDGYSAEWGASWGDVFANTTGTALYVGQELLWNEQRIVPKFSFNQTYFASQRPNVLGSSWNEQILKDYNGQTYWLSFNLYDFTKEKTFPKWLNVALGYGATGMVSGYNENSQLLNLPSYQRNRQFYLSLDINLQKIPTKNRVLQTLFSAFNFLKIPAPTLEYQASGNWKGHWIYY